MTAKDRVADPLQEKGKLRNKKVRAQVGTTHAAIGTLLKAEDVQTNLWALLCSSSKEPQV